LNFYHQFVNLYIIVVPFVNANPWGLAEIRTPYLGIIIFIRRDYVGYTIHQKRAQFETL